MFSQFQDALNVYLFPFLIAVPIALVLFLLATRRDDPPAEHDTNPVPPPAVAATTSPAAAGAPTESMRQAPTPLPLAVPGYTPPQAEPASAQVSARTDAPPRDAQPAPASPDTQGLPLLVVDDSAVARAKLRKLFEAAGYQVQLARDGVEALDLLGRQRFGLMITDLEMPNMDGVELIAAASGSLETEGMPILAITGHDDLQAKVHECQGLYGIFKKPWNDRELLRRVQTLMRVQQAELAQH